MKKIAEDICEILHDYHAEHDFKFTANHVINWVNQFDPTDREFILTEFLHLLNHGIYIDKNKGRRLLLSCIKGLASQFKFDEISEFLKHADFLSLQPSGKSQSILLEMVDDILIKNYGVEIAKCGSKSKKYAIYIDDILATGNSARKYLKDWLVLKNSFGGKNIDDVINGTKILIVSVFCLHTWPDIGMRLKRELDRSGIENKIKYRYHYLIENHPTKPNQRFNFTYPVKNQPKEVLEFLDGLKDKSPWPMTKKEYAFRNSERPEPESLFSSAANRVRFENILVKKGVEILNGATKLNDNQRPLGNINPSFQTLGTGTLFFTWANVSNTSPVVFWWGFNNWQYLFPIVNRG